MKQQDKKNCLVMWVPAYWSFLRSFYNSDFSHCGMKPMASLVETIGIEPILGGPCFPLSSQRPIPIWCRVTELNHRHGDFQSPALPTELTRHILDA